MVLVFSYTNGVQITLRPIHRQTGRRTIIGGRLTRGGLAGTFLNYERRSYLRQPTFDIPRHTMKPTHLQRLEAESK